MTPELDQKREKIAAIMEQRGLDALLLGTHANFAWGSAGGRNHIVTGNGDTIGVGALLFRKGQDAPLIFADTIEARRLAEEEATAWLPEWVAFDWFDPSSRQTALRTIVGTGRVGADMAMAGAEDVTAAIKQVRMALTEAEIERYHALGQATATALEAVVGTTITPGMSEGRIAGLAADALYAHDILPVVVLVATDARIFRRRHPLPVSDKTLERYAMVVVCGSRDGLIANCTRLVHFGALPDELRTKLDACAYVDASYAHYTRAGATSGEVFARGQAAYAERGFADEWRLHHQGGATGYATREWLGRPDGTDTVQRNGAFAWNPSITGVKTEDTFVLTDKGEFWLTNTGTWPTVSVTVDGRAYQRPAILER